PPRGRDPCAVRSLARDPAGRRRLVQRLRAGDRRPHGPALRPRALRPALRRLSAPRRLPARDGTGDPQHGRGAAPHLARDAGSEDRDRRRRLRGRRRPLPRLVRRRRRRARDRAGRRADPRLSTLPGRAARRPARRAGTSALMAALAYTLTAPLAAHVMTFAPAWELMSLASYVLVLDGARAGREPAASAHAGWVYAVMTHAGLACMLAGMLLLTAWTGSARFADWTAA